MIDVFSNWAKNIAVVIIVISILEMLLPNNKTKKYVKSIFGLFVVLNIISPFIGQEKMGEIEAYLDEGINQEYALSSSSLDLEENSINSKLNNIYVTEIEKDIINKLKENNYQVDTIDVAVDIEEDLYISKVKMEVSKLSIEEAKQSTNSLESKLEVVVDKIEPIVIGNTKINNEEEEDKRKCTTTDLEKISEFLIKEYEVSKECLEIKSSY